MKFEIYIHYAGWDIRTETSDYLMAWKIYHMVQSMYPPEVAIDLVDLATGEVFHSNQYPDD